MTIRHYLLHGMPVRSEVALPETEQAQPFASSGGELRIVLGPAEVSAPDFPEGVREILRVSSGDRVMQIGGVTRTSSWLLRWPEVLELRLDPSATVLTAVPDPRADAGIGY